MIADHAYKVGCFLGWHYNMLRERNGDTDPARIVIGKDTRRSSYMFEYSLGAGLTASGADTYLLHVTNTPSVAYIARVDDFDCGTMISASRKPFYDTASNSLTATAKRCRRRPCSWWKTTLTVSYMCSTKIGRNSLLHTGSTLAAPWTMWQAATATWAT